jgi:tetratricopeptide (TPR) repeat protein
MKNIAVIITIVLAFIVFKTFSQERQNEVRKKLAFSVDKQSEIISKVTGWSRIENQEGKFWKQSDLDNELSYLPGFNVQFAGFYSFQLFKITLEGKPFYLLNRTSPCDTKGKVLYKVYMFSSSSFQNLINTINRADGIDHRVVSVRYLTNDLSGENFDPEAYIDEATIRTLLFGEKNFGNLSRGKDSLFIVNSQLINSEPIVRFNFELDNSPLYSPQYSFAPITDNYFEMKRGDFEKLFEFSSYESEFKYFRLATKKRDLKDYTGAVEDLSTAIKFNPNNPNYYNYRALMSTYLHNYDQAINDYSKAIDLSPQEFNYNSKITKEDVAAYYYNRANAKIELKDYKGALEDCTMSWKINCNAQNSEAPLMAGYLCFKAGLFKDALGYFTSASSIYDGRVMRGRCEYELKNFREAYYQLNLAIGDDEKSPDAFFYRGRASLAMNDTIGAIEDFSYVVKTDKLPLSDEAKEILKSIQK